MDGEMGVIWVVMKEEYGRTGKTDIEAARAGFVDAADAALVVLVVFAGFRIQACVCGGWYAVVADDSGRGRDGGAVGGGSGLFAWTRKSQPCSYG